MHSSRSIPPNREEVEKWLRDALNHLYDIGYLENHPLVELLVRPGELTGKRGQDLRRVLISTIQARKPPRGAPIQSPDWRGYQILEQHILAGLSPAEVMQKMNISRSLFFLEKARILKVLFDDLWFNRMQSSPSLAASPETETTPAAGPVELPQPELTEAAQLLQNAIFEPVEIRSLLNSVRPFVELMAHTQQTHLEVIATGDGVIPHGDRVLIRQVLLSLVAELLQLVPGGQMTLLCLEQVGKIGIQIEARKSLQDQLVLRLEDRHGLQPETSYQIIHAMKGELTVAVDEDGTYRAMVAWFPVQGARKLLLIDDQADIADLFTRYLDGTGWEVVWASSTENARHILVDLHPALIVLDVIIPLEDGWEFLIGLKADSHLRAIPVVVCSAINEPDLVRSLGAQAYLPKPFSAAQLIQTLAPWV